MLRQFGVPVALMASVLACGDTVLAQQSDDSTGESRWFRKIFPLNVSADEAMKLNVAADGHVSLYFNGQRLLKNRNPDGNVLSLDITPLCRGTRNCVAISVAGEAAQERLSVWLSSAGQPDVQLTGWKGTTVAPPVGWQQTDFNDRDWKPAVVKAFAGSDEANRQTVEWSPSAGASRYRNGRFLLRDGDHVLLVGGTFIERAQQYGHLECALNRDPRVSVTFRNLGWSADTVYAESRGIFDTPEKGYERLIEHVRAEEPTVILLCYGQNEAMSSEDPAGFVTGLRNLYRDLATTGAEIVFLSPHPFMVTPKPLPNAARWNQRLQKFSAAAAELAGELDAPFVNLFPRFLADMAASHNSFGNRVHLPLDFENNPERFPELRGMWTENGMHWNDNGYCAIAALIANRLTGNTVQAPTLTVAPDRKKVIPVGCEVRNIRWNADDRTLVTFEFRTPFVASFPPTVVLPDRTKGLGVTFGPDRLTGLSEEAAIALVADERGSRIQFEASVNAPYDRLRQLTARKNELYFYRWRPQNITYLYGFRKHEQGNNANEIAMFDPLVDELEKSIHAAKQPTWQQVTVRKREATAR